MIDPACRDSRCRHLEADYCWALDTVDTVRLGCLAYEAAKHIAPPVPFCFSCRGMHDAAWSCDGEPLFKP